MLIVVPTHNESKRLDVHSFLEFIKKNDLTFLFVNDGSTDDTLKILSQMQKAVPEKIKVLNLEKNEGKAHAVHRGMDKALDELDHHQYCGFYDADLATPLEELIRMREYLAINPIDCLIATRFLHLGAEIQRKAYRHYLGRVFATVVSIMLGIKIYDTQCGAKLFTKELASTIFKEKFVSKWFFDIELLFRILKTKKKSVICEFPLKKWEDKDGSKLKLKDFIFTPFELLKIYFFYKMKK